MIAPTGEAFSELLGLKTVVERVRRWFLSDLSLCLLPAASEWFPCRYFVDRKLVFALDLVEVSFFYVFKLETS